MEHFDCDNVRNFNFLASGVGTDLDELDPFRGYAIVLDIGLKMNFDIKEHTIYRCRHGSHAYGTNIPGSDEDFKGVAVSPLVYYFGATKKFEQHEKYVSKGHDCDETIYDVRKFINLARQCNPSILEVLYCDEEDILFSSYEGQMLRNNRDIFLSKAAKHRFTGFAISQLKRIRNGREEGEEKLSPKNCKHGMHLVRLLRMGIEILKGEGVQVRRKDAKELLEIRNGEWTHEDLIKFADSKIAEIDELYSRSSLPHSPDEDRIDVLCMDIIWSFHGLSGPAKCF